MDRVKYLWIAVFLIVISWAITAYEHGFAHFLGIDTQQSQNYDFVSGVGPMIVTVLMGAGVFVTVFHHLNCHVTGCWGIARYPMAGGEFKVCRRHSHHPEQITHSYILERHTRHEARGSVGPGA